MKLTLHIGTEKTGTTSLQAWFVSNRAPLLDQSLRYSTSLGATSHRRLAIYARDADKPDDGFRQMHIKSPDEHAAFRSKLRSAFAQERSEFASAENWIISSEHLHSRLTTIEMVGRVKGFFGNQFDDTEVFVHLRPQIDVAVSLASTATRVGHKIGVTWFSPKSALDTYYNYDLLVRRWENVFGTEAVRIVPFKRQPCLASALIEHLNIDARPLSPLERKNEALDWRSIALVNAILRHNPACDPRSLFLDDWPVRQRLEVGLDVAREFQSVHEESNASLIARRSELAPGDLTPDWQRYEASPNLTEVESITHIGEHLDYLVTRMRSETLLERCARHLAECERALADGRLPQAQSSVKKAENVFSRIPRLDTTLARVESLRRRTGRCWKRIKRSSRSCQGVV